MEEMMMMIEASFGSGRATNERGHMHYMEPVSTETAVNRDGHGAEGVVVVVEL